MINFKKTTARFMHGGRIESWMIRKFSPSQKQTTPINSSEIYQNFIYPHYVTVFQPNLNSETSSTLIDQSETSTVHILV